MDAYRILVMAHACLGTVALVSFWTAALSRKGSPRHKSAGRIYVKSMLGIIATALPIAVREARDVDLRDGDRDDIFAFTVEQLSLRHILAKVLPDLAANDRPKPRVILIDLQRHGLGSV